MTGWIIFGVIIALLATPLFVPLTLNVGLDKRRREWSVQVGTLQVAPEGEVYFKAFRERWSRRLRPLKIAATLLWTLLLYLLRAVLAVFQIVFWPFKTLLSLLKRRRRTRPRPYEEDLRAEPASPPAPLETPSEPSAPQPEMPSGELRREPDDTAEFISTAPREPHPPEPEEAKPEDRFGPEPEDWEPLGPELEEARAEREKEPAGFSKLFGNLGKGLEYLRIYGPLARKILRAAFAFIGDCFRAVHFKQLDARYGFGGDPAALGTLLGWHYALVSSIHPSLVNRIRFEPEFDEEEAPVWGTLDAVVVIWPYRFIPPILALIARMPWLRVYRTVRAYQRGDGLLPDAAPPPNTGVAA